MNTNKSYSKLIESKPNVKKLLTIHTLGLLSMVNKKKRGLRLAFLLTKRIV